MVELIILVMLSFLAAATAVRVYEWRHDVLWSVPEARRSLRGPLVDVRTAQVQVRL